MSAIERAVVAEDIRKLQRLTGTAAGYDVWQRLLGLLGLLAMDYYVC
jgi:hypothetical protein